ncbi:MAG: hypothetical protein ACI9MC_004052, partial [Kiritimatiellia bacterium]
MAIWPHLKPLFAERRPQDVPAQPLQLVTTLGRYDGVAVQV